MFLEMEKLLDSLGTQLQNQGPPHRFDPKAIYVPVLLPNAYNPLK